MSDASPVLRTHLDSFAKSRGMAALRQQMLYIAVVLIIAAVVLMGTNLFKLQASLLETQAAENTILEITTVETRLVDLNGQLGSPLFQKDPWFAKHRSRSTQELEVAMQKLQRSLQNDPVQLAALRALQPLFGKREALNAQLDGLDGTDPAAQLELVRNATRNVNRIRAQLWKILLAERAKRLTSHARMIAEARKSFWLAVGIVTFGFMIGVMFFWLSSSGRPSPTPRT